MPQFSDDLFLGSAPTFMGTAKNATASVVTGSVTGTVLTVTALQSGDPLTVGQYVTGTGITAGSYITSFATGSGTTGTYNLSASSSATGSITVTASGNYLLGDPAPMSLGVGPLGRIYIWDVIPEAKQVANISAAVIYAAAGTATLAAGTSTQSVVRTDGTTVIQLDCPRAVSVTTGSGSPASANFTVSGYDYYGQAMTEVIASGTVASTTTPGKKAFYQISSISVSAGTTVAVSVGTTDVLGCPIRFTDAGYIISAGWASALAEDTGTATVADMTNPATSTTGDVRGTYIPSSATNGVRRLVCSLAVPAIAVGPNATRLGALGVNQA